MSDGDPGESLQAEPTSMPLMKRPLTWAVILFIAAVIHAIWAVSIGWFDEIGGPHDFRQTQTAISCYYMLEGDMWKLAYDTPVYGAPWPMPMEFPLYQWLVVGVVRILGMPLAQAGRAVSVAMFFATLVPLYSLLGTLGVARPQRLLMMSLLLVSPFYLFWSRTFMIETTALFFSVTYLTFAALYTKHRQSKFIVLACVCGAIAALVKITTFVVFIVPALYLLGTDLIRWPFQWPAFADLRRRIVVAIALVVVALAAGTTWTRFADAVKEENPIGRYNASSSAFAKSWVYGTAEQKLSWPTWKTIIGRAPTILTDDKALWLTTGLALLITGRRRKEALACCFLYLLSPLLFTNLHWVHDYYMCANGIFLLGLFGFAIAAIAESAGGMRAAFAGTALAVFLGYTEFRSSYANIQRESHHAAAAMVKGFVADTDPDAVIIYLGMHMSPVWPYYSERRALMIPEWEFLTDDDVRTALENLRGQKIGAVLATPSSRYPLESLIRQMKAAGLDTMNIYRL